MLNINQYGGGACSLCGSAGTNKTTCPLNPLAKNTVKAKHPLAGGLVVVPPLPVKAVEPVKRSFSKTPESFYGSPVAAPAPLPLAAPLPLPAAQAAKRSLSKTPDSFYGSPTLKAISSPTLPSSPVAAAAAAPAPAAFKRALPPSLMLNFKCKPLKKAAEPASPKAKAKFGAKAKGVINNLFKHFYPIWATYHVNNGKSYNGMFVGHKSSAEPRGFVEYIYEKYHTDPETMDFWLHGTTKEILDELAYDPSVYFSGSNYNSLKG